jgi:hypothetical protein
MSGLNYGSKSETDASRPFGGKGWTMSGFRLKEQWSNLSGMEHGRRFVLLSKRRFVLLSKRRSGMNSVGDQDG